MGSMVSEADEGPVQETRKILRSPAKVADRWIFIRKNNRLERDVIVFLPRVIELLCAQHVERPGHPAAGRVRHDHIIEETTFRRDEGICEAVLVVLDSVCDLLLVAQFGAVDDFGCPLLAHHRDLGSGPGIVDVAAQVL